MCITKPSDEKLNKLLAVFITLTICVSRISMAVGQALQCMALLAGIILFFRQKRKLGMTQEAKKYYVVAMLFFISTAVSAIGAENPREVLVEFLNMWIWRSVIFVLITAFIHRKDYLLGMLTTVLVVHGIECFTAFAEFLIYGGRGWGFGSLGSNPLGLSGMMCLMFPAVSIILLDDRFEKKLKTAAAFCLVGILAGLIGCQSRGSWLVVILMTPVIVAPYAAKDIKKVAAVGAICLIIVGIFATNPAFVKRLKSSVNVTTNWSNTHRLWLWGSAVNMFKDHPVNGIGLGNFKEFYKNRGYWLHNGKMEPREARLLKKKGTPRVRVKVGEKNNKAIYVVRPKNFLAASHAHNSYFHYLAETGAIGIVSLLFFVVYFLGNSLRNWLKERQACDFIFFTSFLSFFVLFAQVEHIIDRSSAIRMMWFLLAVLLQMKAAEGKEAP